MKLAWLVCVFDSNKVKLNSFFFVGGFGGGRRGRGGGRGVRGGLGELGLGK